MNYLVTATTTTIQAWSKPIGQQPIAEDLTVIAVAKAREHLATTDAYTTAIRAFIATIAELSIQLLDP